MTPPPPVRNGIDAVLLWLACAIAGCIGAYVVFGILGSAIDAQHTRTGRISDAMLAQAQEVAGGPFLADADAALTDRLRVLDLRADRATLVARFIHELTAVAAARRLEIVRIDERPAPLVDAAHDDRHGALPFDVIPLDLTIRGTYGDILGAIRDLALTPVAMHIDIAAIDRDAATSGITGAAPLTAHLRVAVDRLLGGAAAPSAPLAPAKDISIHARPL